MCLAGCGGDDGGDGPERGTLALDFQPNAVHAGIYAADNIRIRVPSASTDSLKLFCARWWSTMVATSSACVA